MHLASMRVECLSNVLYDTPTSSVRPSAWRPLLMAEISAKTLMAKNIANFGLKMGCCGQKYAYWPIKLLSWLFRSHTTDKLVKQSNPLTTSLRAMSNPKGEKS